MRRADRVNAKLRYFEQMVQAYDRLSEAKKAELAEWDRTKLNGEVGTSDWPGWGKHIGPPPWREANWSS